MRENVESLLNQIHAIAGTEELREARARLDATIAREEAEDADDNTQDLTVYDLAEKIAAGRMLTVSANIEIQIELQRLEVGVASIAAGCRVVDAEPKQMIDIAKRLLQLRAELEKLLNPATP